MQQSIGWIIAQAVAKILGLIIMSILLGWLWANSKTGTWEQGFCVGMIYQSVGSINIYRWLDKQK